MKPELALQRPSNFHVRQVFNCMFDTHREALRASVDTLVRQCDAKLPLVLPSLFDQPITERRWNAYLRDESLVGVKDGTPMERIAVLVRLALRAPQGRRLEAVAACWLPDEDALRAVTVATRDAVQAWWHEGPRSSEPFVPHAILAYTLAPNERPRLALTALLAFARPWLGAVVDDLQRALGAARSFDELRAVRVRIGEAMAARGANSVPRALRGALVALDEGVYPHDLHTCLHDQDSPPVARADEAVRTEVRRVLRAQYPTLDLECVWR